ncbi:MAG TPA: hypothetical protein DCS93_23060 [Microscillaceae bacterium]|nr:hypothetical protein [Microscillaceae bacterium]
MHAKTTTTQQNNQEAAKQTKEQPFKLGQGIVSPQSKHTPIQAKQRPIQRKHQYAPIQAKQTPVQRQQNTQPKHDQGLPKPLKAGIEQLSGYAMDDVKVHRNSDKPAQLKVHAYAQGSDIHLAPGQEHHLPHEAWHVVQQKQGRVSATTQLKGKQGVAINDDAGLEREADVMGARAMRPNAGLTNATVATPASPQVSNTAPIQLKKYVQKGKRVFEREDGYKLKRGEKEITKDEYRAYLVARHGPQKGEKKKAPRVQGVIPRTSGKKKGRKKKKKSGRANQQVHLQDIELNYRGMSVNNIKNLQDGDSDDPIFTVQNPDGRASAVEHIVDDAMDSPYLSFEKNTLAVSAGKYAPKPVDRHNRPLGVRILSGGFLKQEKSYVEDGWDEYDVRDRIGLVGGILPQRSDEDYSTLELASQLVTPAPTGEKQRAKEKRLEKDKKARDLAVADEEVLVRPGPDGISRRQVPFLARVKRVPQEYYQRHIMNQTPQKALGFFNGLYYKLQLDSRSDDAYNFSFSFDPELARRDDESDDEMSDIEDLDFDFDRDISEETSSESTPKPVKKPVLRRRVPADFLAEAIREYINNGTAVPQGPGQNPDALDLAAMEEQAVSKKESSKKSKGKKKSSKKDKKKAYVEEANWDITDYGAGGDCLFYSLSASGNLRTAQTLREEIALYQSDNGLIQQGFVDAELTSLLESSPHPQLSALAAASQGRQNISTSAYHRLMAHQGTWGGRMEVQSFSALRNTTVYVIEYTGLITQYTNGNNGVHIAQLPVNAFANGVVLYKTVGHWRRVNGPANDDG